MIPIDLLVALTPTLLLVGLWVADRLRDAGRRRLNRRQLLRLVAVANRRPQRVYHAGLL